MEFILFMAVSILVVLGLMFAVSSEGKNPTPKQIANRIIMRRKWRKFKKMLAVRKASVFIMLLYVFNWFW